jgi:hypothetical protein
MMWPGATGGALAGGGMPPNPGMMGGGAMPPNPNLLFGGGNMTPNQAPPDFMSLLRLLAGSRPPNAGATGAPPNMYQTPAPSGPQGGVRGFPLVG